MWTSGNGAFGGMDRRGLIASWIGLVALAGCQTDTASTGGGEDPTALGSEITDIISETRMILSGISDQATAEEAQQGLEILNGRMDSVIAQVSGLGEDAKATIADTVEAGLPLVRRALNKALEVPDTADAIRPLVEQILDKLRALAA